VKFVDSERGWIGGIYQLGILGREASGACAPPIPYCTPKMNSAGGEAHLHGEGSLSAALDQFDVGVSGALPRATSILAWSEAGAASAPFLGGTRCLAFPLRRYPVFFTDDLGNGSRSVPLRPDMIGKPRWFQVYYRDAAHPDGTGFGMSDGLEVTFCP
jgi:hypothetical protein